MKPSLFLSLSIIASLTPSSATGASLTRGPYLHQSTPTSIVMVWETDSPTDSKIRLGETTSTLNSTYQSDSQLDFHVFRITDLEPNHRYYYSIGTTTEVLAGGDSSYYFDTAPDPSSDTPIRLWVVGDSGTGDSNQAEVRDAMLNATSGAAPDLFIHVGDMAYNRGEDSEFQENFFDVYQTTLRHSVIWPTLGNHEGRSSSSANQSGPYYESYVLPQGGEAGGIASGTEAYYSFDYGNVHFIVLDSHHTSREAGGPMLTWLSDDIASTSKEWLIAFWHHPPYTKGSHDSDDEDRLIEMRENALPILEAGGVDLVLAGHSHIFERSHLVRGAYDTPTSGLEHILDSGNGFTDGPYQKGPDGEGSVYVVAGHGGAYLYQQAVHPLMAFTETIHGSCIIDIDGPNLDFYNLRKDGIISDRFTLTRGDSLNIVRPSTSTMWLVGTEQTIQWSSTPAESPVDLSFRLGTGDWQTLGTSISDDYFNWVVPFKVSEHATLRVETSTPPHLQDEVSFTITNLDTVSHINFGDTWNYYDDNVDPGPTWFSPDFDDSHWNSGNGEFGYGDGDETTSLNNTAPNTPSAYFRNSFNLETLPESVDLSILHDDGVAIWLNGSPVFSKYMDHGTTFEAWASETSADNERATLTLSPEQRALLQLGSNLIAVQVKQTSGSSSDLSFDLVLTTKVLVEEPNETDPSTEVEEPAPQNQPPSLSSIGTHELTVGVPFTLQLRATDPEGDALSFRATNLPTSATLAPTQGIFNWEPTFLEEGERTIQFQVSDSTGNSDTQYGLFQIGAPPTSNPPSSPPTAEEGPGSFNGTSTETSGCACSHTGTPQNHLTFFIFSLLGVVVRKWRERPVHISALESP